MCKRCSKSLRSEASSSSVSALTYCFLAVYSINLSFATLKNCSEPSMVPHVCKLRALEAEARRSQVLNQPGYIASLSQFYTSIYLLNYNSVYPDLRT